MLDVIWPVLIVAALVCGALAGRLDAVSTAITESAAGGVQVAISLLGNLVLWLGLVHVLEVGGFVAALGRALRPLMRRLFPDVPAEHPAMGFMVLSISSNMLGLGNAATPFGLKAMVELDRLNPRRGVATDAMVMFLAINTANVTLFPAELIGIRAGLGARAPGSIVLPTLLATLLSTAVAVLAAKLLGPLFPLPRPDGRTETAPDAATEGGPAIETNKASTPASPGRRWLARVLGAALVATLAPVFVLRAGWAEGPSGWGAAVRHVASLWMLPLLVATIAVWGLARGVAVYERAVEGGREAFGVALKVVPNLVIILVATGMLRASGAFDLLLGAIAPVAGAIHIPPEALPMGVLRSLSGSGSRGFAIELMKLHGPDSFVGNVVSVIQGSTETTFYVLAVYFGAVQVRLIRHALLAALLADVAGVFASVWACRLLL